MPAVLVDEPEQQEKVESATMAKEYKKQRLSALAARGQMPQYLGNYYVQALS